jgi:FkbM family methyltransferase
MQTASSQDFKQSVIGDFLIAMHRTVPDNYDARRYNLDGGDHSREFSVREHSFFLDWFHRHHHELYQAQQALQDEASRALFKSLVLFRLGGHLHVRIPSAVQRNADRLLAFQQTALPGPCDLQLDGLFGQLAHYDFEWDGRHFEIDCIKDGLAPTLVLGQYVYERAGIRIAPEAGDHVIDGGACLGDTAMLFSHLVGPQGHVYAFDPVEEHLLVCLENQRTMPHANVTVLPVGIANEDVDAPPLRLGRYAPGFSTSQGGGGEGPLPLRRIDSLVEAGEVERIDFIKFDIEGAEMDGLRGAARSIARWRPKLAISLYHKPNDLFEIILHIAQQFPFYEMHLDHYTIHREETVLYCVARD